MCRAKCFEWLHVSCSRLELPIPDRNRYVPDRYVPFPISRNIISVFPSAFPIPVSISGKENRNMNGLGVFPTIPFLVDAIDFHIGFACGSGTLFFCVGKEIFID